MGDSVRIKLADVPEMSARGFQVSSGGDLIEAMLVNYRGEFYAYVNSCPHTGITLEWQKDQFFDVDHKFLHCSLHGALFQPQDGLCISGPCLGKSLKSLPLKLEADEAVVYI